MAQENIADLKDLKPFEQKPYWDANAVFPFTGIEFERMFNALQPFLGLAYIFQTKMDKALNDGTIKVKYEYLDGSGELTEEQVKSLTEQMEVLLREEKLKQEQSSQPVAEDNVKPLNKIITDI